MKERGPNQVEIMEIWEEVREYFRTPQAIKNIPSEKTEKEITPPAEQVQDKTSPKK